MDLLFDQIDHSTTRHHFNILEIFSLHDDPFQNFFFSERSVSRRKRSINRTSITTQRLQRWNVISILLAHDMRFNLIQKNVSISKWIHERFFYETLEYQSRYEWSKRDINSSHTISFTIYWKWGDYSINVCFSSTTTSTNNTNVSRKILKTYVDIERSKDRVLGVKIESFENSLKMETHTQLLHIYTHLHSDRILCESGFKMENLLQVK